MPRPRKHLLSPFPGAAHYHCISRAVDRRFVFGAREREVFRKILRQVEAFSGVQVITWTMLSNHFHILLRVPPRPRTMPSDEEILERCRALYTPLGMQAVEAEFEAGARMGEAELARVRAKYLKRMWDLSEFMKTLKQKFTGWFNRQRARVGTLWESRFSSVLVEGRDYCLLKVAAYIDLNPVRAGLVEDPKDYRWCGYAEAVAGERAARAGLFLALGDAGAGATWRELGRRYREVLFGICGGGAPGADVAVPSPGDAAGAIASDKALTLVDLLRCRVRYFSAGLAIGGEAFVEAFFRMRPQNFSARRQSGARRMKGGVSWGELRSARDLAVEPLGPSGAAEVPAAATDARHHQGAG